MKFTTIKLLSCILFIGASFFSISQTAPLSLAKAGNFVEKIDLDKGVPSLTVPKPDLEALKSEDIVRDKNAELFRIAQAVPSNTNVNSIGEWTTLSDGSKILRMKVKSTNAEALAISFSNFYLPEGATFRAYNKDQWHFSKTYSFEDNREDNGFMLPMVFGEEIVLEFWEPANSNQGIQASIEDVFYVYRESGNPMVRKDFGDSDPCQVNVRCSPEGDNWLDENRGVARIFVVVGGSGGWCTGSLVNNTAQNCKPYFLTALHCGDGASAANMNNWVFYFNYEAPGCANPATQGTLANSTINGCVRISDSNDGGGNSGSDFLLVQLGSLSNEIATVNTLKSYNARWNGWDANNTTSSQGVSIHNPAGDIKKISTYSSNLVSTTWGGPAGSHWRVTWAATPNGHGVTEGGSSGSPIFRYNGGGAAEDSKIIGTLTGGSSFCSSPTSPDLYGKMSYHWQSNGGNNNEQLRPFLDPGNTGLLVMNGSDDPCSAPAAPEADFVANQTTVLEGAVVQFTDLTTGVPTSWLWTITPGTNGVDWEYTNGTTATDQNPQVLFTTPGFYTVSLTATNGFGNDTETKVDYIEVVEIVCSDPISSAYTMSFETGEDLSQWVVIDANGANTWGIYNFGADAYDGTNAAGYFYDQNIPANDWLITNCFDFVAGAEYTISYWWRTGAGFNENVEFFIGTDQTIGAMTTSLAQHVNVSNATWTQQVVNFTVPSSGVYYFGWHCTSAADEWFFAIDAINLTGSIPITITNTPANMSVECDESTDPSNTGELTATSGCAGGATVSHADVVTSGSCANAYSIERTWTITDGCGNTETHIQTINVVDNTAPVVVCGQATDEITTSTGNAQVPNYLTGATISDNCSANGDMTIVQSPTSGTTLSSGSHVITITATDECGNSNTCEIALTITNDNGITITSAPANLNIECDESTDPSNTGQLTAGTTCAGGVTITYSDVSNGNTCPEVITRTWTVEDGCANSETYVQTITINDLTAPTGTAPANMSVQCLADVPTPNTSSVTGVSDNCTVAPSVVWVNDVSDGNTCPELITRSYSITDDCGNQIVVTQLITVNDNTDPSITCSIANETIFTADGTGTPNYVPTVSATDNCSASVTITQSPTAGSTLSLGANVITMTATDDCGNSSTCEINVTLEDNVNLDNQGLNTMMVFPNPAHSLLNIDFGKTMERASLKLYDSNGKLVLDLNAVNETSVQMDISSIAKGIYQLIITSNTEVVMHKISKM